MKYRKLDPQGDFSFGSGLQDFYQGTDAIGQAIYTGLKLLQNEWWENTALGLPLFQIILQPGISQAAKDSVIRNQILSTQGVTSMQSFASVYNSATRSYAVSAVANTETGNTVTIQESW
jgi:hypothetical protein